MTARKIKAATTAVQKEVETVREAITYNNGYMFIDRDNKDRLVYLNDDGKVFVINIVEATLEVK